MSQVAWRYAAASVAGSRHTRLGEPCQDANVCAVLETARGRVLVAVVADGAGSASCAAAGAALACAVFAGEIAAHYAGGLDVASITREAAGGWLKRFAGRVSEQAATEGRDPRDYACTVLAAVAEPDRAAFVQIGDGAIVLSPAEEPDRFFWVFWPQGGEYANVTRFATDPDADAWLAFDTLDAPVGELALFTDGLQSLALEYGTRTAHPPFFRSFFGPVRTAPAGLVEGLSATLAEFLASPGVNERTDDDKTLVLATRRCAGAQEATSCEDVAADDGAGG